jgi:hypothetical protein
MAISLSLNKRDPFKGVQLEFQVTNDEPETAWVDLSRTFVSEVYASMPKETGWFHQSGVRPDDRPSNYHMFEFWNFQNHDDLVREKCKELASRLGIAIEIVV